MLSLVTWGKVTSSLCASVSHYTHTSRETTEPCRSVLYTKEAQSSGFPGGSNHRESACSAGDPGSIPESGRSPGEGNGNPLQYSCLENPHGQRSLADYSPWGRKESDTTERLTLVIVVAFSPVPGPYYGLIR